MGPPPSWPRPEKSMTKQEQADALAASLAGVAPPATPMDQQAGKGVASAHLQFVEETIENEIARGCNQRQIAQTYALALQSSWPTNWTRVNEAITNRWPTALDRIKKLAWSGKCFGRPALAACQVTP